MYYEATRTKGIVIHINVAFSDCVEYLVWPDVRSKHTHGALGAPSLFVGVKDAAKHQRRAAF